MGRAVCMAGLEMRDVGSYKVQSGAEGSRFGDGPAARVGQVTAGQRQQQQQQQQQQRRRHHRAVNATTTSQTPQPDKLPAHRDEKRIHTTASTVRPLLYKISTYFTVSG